MAGLKGVTSEEVRGSTQALLQRGAQRENGGSGKKKGRKGQRWNQNYGLPAGVKRGGRAKTFMIGADKFRKKTPQRQGFYLGRKCTRKNQEKSWGSTHYDSSGHLCPIGGPNVGEGGRIGDGGVVLFARDSASGFTD